MGHEKRNSARGRLLAREEPASGAARAGAADLGQELGRSVGEPELRPEAFLDRAFELEPREWLRRMPGRETFALGERLVAKRYRGDVWREWWHERLRAGPHRSPARREAENLDALSRLGLPVPRPVAWCEDGAAAFLPEHAGRSVMLMELLPHASHLRRALLAADAATARDWILPLAKLVARLHREHWFHRDLYLQHFAVLDAGEHRLALLDCARARKLVPVPARWIAKDLAQLLHSCPPSIGARARLRFLLHYARERGAERAVDVRALARAAIAKEARMRAHAPRHVDPRTANADGSER